MTLTVDEEKVEDMILIKMNKPEGMTIQKKRRRNISFKNLKEERIEVLTKVMKTMVIVIIVKNLGIK